MHRKNQNIWIHIYIHLFIYTVCGFRHTQKMSDYYLCNSLLSTLTLQSKPCHLRDNAFLWSYWVSCPIHKNFIKLLYFFHLHLIYPSKIVINRNFFISSKGLLPMLFDSLLWIRICNLPRLFINSSFIHSFIHSVTQSEN
jgi:hypothetical protein